MARAYAMFRVALRNMLFVKVRWYYFRIRQDDLQLQKY